MCTPWILYVSSGILLIHGLVDLVDDPVGIIRRLIRVEQRLPFIMPFGMPSGSFVDRTLVGVAPRLADSMAAGGD
jgi:hypothetical protein